MQKCVNICVRAYVLPERKYSNKARPIGSPAYLPSCGCCPAGVCFPAPLASSLAPFHSPVLCPQHSLGGLPLSGVLVLCPRRLFLFSVHCGCCPDSPSILRPDLSTARPERLISRSHWQQRKERRTRDNRGSQRGNGRGQDSGEIRGRDRAICAAMPHAGLQRPCTTSAETV